MACIRHGVTFSNMPCHVVQYYAQGHCRITKEATSHIICKPQVASLHSIVWLCYDHGTVLDVLARGIDERIQDVRDPETFELSDWVVEKQIARRARKKKAEKGEKVRRITIHVDKEAEGGMGQATTTGDEGGDKYGTQRPTSEADEDWRPERRASDDSDRSDTDSSSTTNSSSGGTSSISSESSFESSSSDSSAKVVAATGHKKVYKKTAKQPRGQGKQAKSGKAPVAASVVQKRQAPERESSSNSKRQRK